MIRLTSRDGRELCLNHELLETIEEAPDTVLTLTNGHRYLVIESAATVIERIAAFKAAVLRLAAALPPAP